MLLDRGVGLCSFIVITSVSSKKRQHAGRSLSRADHGADPADDWGRTPLH